jgi:hypothetical protein
MPGRKRENGTPMEMIGDGLRKIDVLLNSKREDLVKRLREGSNAWEQRKKQHVVPRDADQPQPQLAKVERPGNRSDSKAKDRRRPWQPRRDDTYSSGTDINELLQRSVDSERERKVKSLAR